ncbi:MAG: hypothetical protein KatS3mg105_3539 [Gemmatales bacterium]|nr:MAG: hypothetical protein KatS3mg105_3539 [Gemmatales bacterium]
MKSILDAVTFYASFDDDISGDVGHGTLTPKTRIGPPAEPDHQVHTEGYDPNVFRIVKDEGVHGGCLEAVDVLENYGRIYFPGLGNLPFRTGGWAGTLSFWLNTDPNELLKTPFCDPVQITQKNALDGGIWIDFNDNQPRDMRMGTIPVVRPGGRRYGNADPDAPMIWVRQVDFKEGDWHHLVCAWENFDTGQPDARAALYIDGQLMGEIAGRELAMEWELDKTGIYVAVSYIGLLDELAIFNRMLNADEVCWLRDHPGGLASLKKK